MLKDGCDLINKKKKKMAVIWHYLAFGNSDVSEIVQVGIVYRLPEVILNLVASSSIFLILDRLINFKVVTILAANSTTPDCQRICHP